METPVLSGCATKPVACPKQQVMGLNLPLTWRRKLAASHVNRHDHVRCSTLGFLQIESFLARAFLTGRLDRHQLEQGALFIEEINIEMQHRYPRR